MMARAPVFLLLLCFAPAVFGFRWVKKTPAVEDLTRSLKGKKIMSQKIPGFVKGAMKQMEQHQGSFRRLEGHKDMSAEDMKKMLEPMLGECEKKCPGVIDGAIDVQMATMNEKDPEKMMTTMINAACPVVDIMKCADKNKDVCSM